MVVAVAWVGVMTNCCVRRIAHSFICADYSTVHGPDGLVSFVIHDYGLADLEVRLLIGLGLGAAVMGSVLLVQQNLRRIPNNFGRSPLLDIFPAGHRV